MADVVNLNRVRKARDKAQAKAAASGNRAAHGLTKAERDLARKTRERAERAIDGHKRDD